MTSRSVALKLKSLNNIIVIKIQLLIVFLNQSLQVFPTVRIVRMSTYYFLL